MKQINYTLVSLLLIIVCISSCTQNETEIYQWRGKDRTGKYEAKNLLKEWQADGPALIWESDSIGNGYGSPVVTPERVYVQGEMDSIGYLFAFGLDGKLQWKVEYGKEWVKNFPGSRSAPTVVDNMIYVCSGLGRITCFNADDGTQKWSVDMLEKYGGVLPLFGISESLVVDGDRVFGMPGGKTHNVIALNRHTGELIWSCEGVGQRPAYNPPRIIEHGEHKILTTFSAYSLLGIDADTGKLLWTHEQTNIPPEKRKPGAGDTHSNTVLYENGFIYYVAGDGNCAVKLKLSDDGTSIDEVWQNKKFDNYMGGFIKLDNYIYGSGIAKPLWYALDAQSGRITDSLKLGKGATIYADGNLYCYTFMGDVALVKPNKDKLELISKFKITKGSRQHFAHPVINNGKLYVRHGNIMQVFSIAENKQES